MSDPDDLALDALESRYAPEPPITVEYVHPPIPDRDMDYCAYLDPEGPIGWGSTRAEAVRDLLEQIREEL